jgi:hypothetical protein
MVEALDIMLVEPCLVTHLGTAVCKAPVCSVAAAKH